MSDESGLKLRRIRPGSANTAVATGTGRLMRPQCPCCVPREPALKPSQKLAERLAALRRRETPSAE